MIRKYCLCSLIIYCAFYDRPFRPHVETYLFVVIFIRDLLLKVNALTRKYMKYLTFFYFKVMYHKIDVSKTPRLAKLQIIVNCPPNIKSDFIYKNNANFQNRLNNSRSTYRIQALRAVRDVTK